MNNILLNHGADLPRPKFRKSGKLMLATVTSGGNDSQGWRVGFFCVLGDGHRQVLANEAPKWFSSWCESIRSCKDNALILVEHIGSAGKYDFFSVPKGVNNILDLCSVTAKFISGEKAEKLAKARARLGEVNKNLATLFTKALPSGDVQVHEMPEVKIGADSEWEWVSRGIAVEHNGNGGDVYRLPKETLFADLSRDNFRVSLERTT